MIPKLDAVALLSINDIDVSGAFPDESKHLVENLTQEQLDEIAVIAHKNLFRFISDEFWADFNDAVLEATMEVIDLDFDEEYTIKEK